MRLARVALSVVLYHGLFHTVVSGLEAGVPNLFNVMANIGPEPAQSPSTSPSLKTGPDGRITPTDPSTKPTDSTVPPSSSPVSTPPTSTATTTSPSETTTYPPWTFPPTTNSANSTTSRSSSSSVPSTSSTSSTTSLSSSSSTSTEYILTTIGSSTSAYQITITSVVGGSALVSTISSSSVVPVTTSYAKGTTLNASDSYGSSGVTDEQRRTIIGVVVGLGGAILLAGLAYVVWRVWVRKDRRYQMEDDSLMKGGRSAWYNIPSGWKPTRQHQRTPTLSRSPTAKITQASNF